MTYEGFKNNHPNRIVFIIGLVKKYFSKLFLKSHVIWKTLFIQLSDVSNLMNEKLRLATVLLMLPLFAVTLTAFTYQEVDAAKAQGSPSSLGPQSYGSKNAHKICGDELCSVKKMSSMMSDKMMSDKKMSDKMMSDKKMSDKMMSDKKMSDKMMSDKKMSDKMMSDKKMSDKMMSDKKSMDGKTAWDDNAMPDKMMSDKKMSDKMMSDKKTMLIGGVDLSSASPIFGSKDAKVTIIEFGDYQCPKCDQWFLNERPTVESQYIAKNKANLYFVDFTFLGPDSELASAATYCADEQGKYWDYHNTLYKNQAGIQSGWANSDSLKKFASSVGLDTGKFNKCLESGKYSDRVKQNKQIGTSSGVEGTPTFLLVGPNGKTEKIVGPQPSAVFASTIEKLLK
jgi:protein-disulfide isomerase